MKIRWMWSFLFMGILLCGPAAYAQMSSANYNIPGAVINTGGGVMSSANYTLVASIGEPIVGLTTAITGDVNKDGFVNAGDVGTVLRISGGNKNSADSDVNFSAADADASTKIDLLDAEKLLKLIQSGTGTGFRLDAGFIPAAFQ